MDVIRKLDYSHGNVRVYSCRDEHASWIELQNGDAEHGVRIELEDIEQVSTFLVREGSYYRSNRHLTPITRTL